MAEAKKETGGKIKLVAVGAIQAYDDVSEAPVHYMAGDEFDMDAETAETLIASGAARKHMGAKKEAELGDGGDATTTAAAATTTAAAAAKPKAK